MSENAQRVGILVITLIFLVTTIGIALYAIIFSDSGGDQLSDAELQQLLEQQQEEEVQPQRGIEGFEPVSEVTELKLEDKVVGTGAEVKDGDTVTVDYIGVLASTGEGFDNSIDRGQPATFPLSGVIEGWQKGIPGMKEGGTRWLYIPAEQAYGESSPSPLIPANSDLVFEVKLIKVGE